MCGRASEVVETIGCIHIDVYCVQESRWKGYIARLISVNGFKFKFIWSRVNSGFGGVCVLHNENWIDKVISIVKLNHHIKSIHFLVGKLIINIFSAYAPQIGLSVDERDIFYIALLSVTSQLSHLMSIC